MKKILAVLSVFLLLLCSGCSNEYPFQYDEAEIDSIEIVSLKYSIATDDMPEEILICRVESISDFLYDFSKIKITNVSPPERFNEVNTPTAVKIKYRNGEFEWIAPRGTVVYRADDSYMFYGVNHLDDKQFAELIEQYVGKIPLELEYNFLFPTSTISSVEIVKLGESKYSDRISEEQTIICEIEDVADFLVRFAELDCFLNTKVPNKVQDEEFAFKISYGSDNYELVGVNGQSKFYSENFANDGYRYFNEQQFDNLINYYIG